MQCLTLCKNNKLGSVFCRASLALVHVHIASGSPQIVSDVLKKFYTLVLKLNLIFLVLKC